MPDLGELARGLDKVMEERGDWPARSPWIREAVAALPRDRFAPDRLYRWDGHAYAPIDRHTAPDVWADGLYASPDTAAVTQVTEGVPSSSLSCQGVVVDMLDALRLEPGHRVLELGTGTGWNAALLASRVVREGASEALGRVVSVEVDEGLADLARARLEAAGARVDVRVGDGARGWPHEAPYDRIISTYAVDVVPWAWVEQCRPGGRIVLPWGRLGHVALTVAQDGRSAVGWMQGLAQFMPARNTQQPTLYYAAIRGTGEAADERSFRDVAPLSTDEHLRFALRVALPDVHIARGIDEDGGNAWLHDNRSSWAALNANGDGTTTAYQGGPRRLADELERAWAHWERLGSPSLWEYGLTVEPGRQYAWCRSAVTGPRWPVAGKLLAPLKLAG